MFPLKSILFLSLFSVGCFGSIFFHPMIGVITYVLDYNISPANHWWGLPLTEMGIQWSKIASISIALGMVIHHKKLNFGKFLYFQEILLIIFVALIWGSQFWGLPQGELTTSNALKMTKIAFFILMLTHIVTTKKRFELLIWTLIILAFYLGFSAYTAPSWAFKAGRLDIGVGGPDFMEGNFLGAHFAMVLPFIGVMFLKEKWWTKILCLVVMAFCVNAIILTRSRGVLLGCAMGVLTALTLGTLFMKGKRTKIISWVTLGIIGAFLLTDKGFWTRMVTLKKTNFKTQNIDASAMGRIWAWEASLKMFKKYPMGIGEGNFKNYVGYFDDRIPGKDTHSTYLRCLAELGILGIFVLFLMIINGFWMLIKIWNLAKTKELYDYRWYVFATAIGLVVFLTCGAFITETYVEEFYWLLFFPVVLLRSIVNEQKESSEQIL